MEPVQSHSDVKTNIFHPGSYYCSQVLFHKMWNHCKKIATDKQVSSNAKMDHRVTEWFALEGTFAV